MIATRAASATRRTSHSPAFFRSYKSYAPFLDKGDPSQRSLTEKAIGQHGWTKGVHSRRVCMYSTLSHRSQHPFVAELIMHPKDRREQELNRKSKRQLILHDTRIRLGLGEERRGTSCWNAVNWTRTV